MLRINLRSGRLELENDRCAESSYESEVGGLHAESLPPSLVTLPPIYAPPLPHTQPSNPLSLHPPSNA